MSIQKIILEMRNNDRSICVEITEQAFVDIKDTNHHDDLEHNLESGDIGPESQRQTI